MMLVQRLPTLASSPALRVEGVKAVSVVSNPPAAPAWIVVPQAAIPLTIVAPVIVAALLVQLVPDPPVPASVEISFITTELGRIPVRVLLMRSFTTERDTNPSGVTRQEQQACNCSSGENA
jgi:hypothetical protein